MIPESLDALTQLRVDHAGGFELVNRFECFALRPLQLILESSAVRGVGPRLPFTHLEALSRLVHLGQPPPLGGIIAFIEFGTLDNACLLLGFQSVSETRGLSFELLDPPLEAPQGLFAVA